MASLLSLRSPAGRPAPSLRPRWWLALPVAALALGVAVGAAVRHAGAGGAEQLLGRIPPAPAAPADVLAAAPDPATNPQGFAGFVGERLDGFWRAAFPAMGEPAYHPPAVDLFGDATSIPCFPLMDFNDGPPYYCDLDDTIYLPVQYLTDLAAATGAGAPVAAAYVLGHEYAHHVQHLTGLGATVESGAAPPGVPAEQALIAYELQADCLAGVWLRTVVPPGALAQPALAALQETAVLLHGGEGAVSADTHGTLPQRQAALWTGYHTGRASRCAAP
jgi:predicted metalloprotease